MKFKWPIVTRARYERELKLAKQSIEYTSRSISDEREQLRSILNGLVRLRSDRSLVHGQLMIYAQTCITDLALDSVFMSPYNKDALWYEVARQLAYNLREEGKLLTGNFKGA